MTKKHKKEIPVFSGELDQDSIITNVNDGVDFKKRFILIGNILNGSLTIPTYNLLKMDLQNHSPITLLIRSSGGEMQEGLQFINIIKSLHSEINTIALDTCQSMALNIFCIGKKRSAFSNTLFLAHKVKLSEDSLDDEKLLKRHKEIKFENEFLIKCISKSSNQSFEWWMKKIQKAKENDYEFNEKYAKKIGIINHEIFNEFNKFYLNEKIKKGGKNVKK